MQIVIAWTEEVTKVVRERRTDLGERPEMERVMVGRAAMWLNDGTADDIAKAERYAAPQGYRVFVYQGVRDPLARARADALRSLAKARAA